MKFQKNLGKLLSNQKGTFYTIGRLKTSDMRVDWCSLWYIQ